MFRFLFGLVFGGAIVAIAGGVAAVMNPLPEGPLSQQAAVAPATDAAPAPMTDTAPATTPATAAPEPAPATAPEPALAVATPEPAPEPAPAPAAAPATITLPGSDVTLTAPGGADGGSLGAPVIAESSGGAGLGGATDSAPVRSASLPQQVTLGETSAAAPSVNTESTGTPEIGGAELDRVVTELPQATLVEGTAIATHAAPFTGDLTQSLMSIILIDEGDAPDLRAGLITLTAPITFGVTAGIENATAVSGDYRQNGFEVVLALPSDGAYGLNGATEIDAVENLIANAVNEIPVATAVIDPIGSPLPQNRRLTGAVLDALKVTGHGLLTYRGGGLNNVPLIADEVGVPSEIVFRVIDEEPGSANIALSLERAVLDASRGGSVIVVGRLRGETVTTLVSWLLGSGAREVSIAPVSTVLSLRQ